MKRKERKKITRMKCQVGALDHLVATQHLEIKNLRCRIDGIGRVVARIADRLDRPEVDD